MGIVVAVLLGLVVIGTDEIRGFADVEDLPGLYVVAAVIGALVGAVTGAVGLVVAVLVARSSAGTPERRRLRGALAAAGVSAVVSTFTLGALFFGAGLAAVIVVGALGGSAAWLLLPSQLDLSPEPAPLATSGETTAGAGPELTVVRRGAITIAAGAVGAFIATNVVMAIISSFGHVERDVADALAVGTLATAFVVIAAVVWRHLVRRTPSGVLPHSSATGQDDASS